MKKIIFLLGLFAQAAAFAVVPPQNTTNDSIAMTATPSKPVKQNITAPASNILTSKKPVYTLRLNSNPTTGFSWFIVSYPSKLLTFVKHEYNPPAKQMPGAGGSEVWQFKATPAAFAAPRIIKIKMIYAQPWDIKDTSTAQTFIVVTK